MVNALLKWLKALPRRIGWGRALSTSLLVALVFFHAWDPLPLELLRNKIFDLYQNTEPRKVEGFPVVIVDIDEASLDKFGQWPWPRDLLAELVDRITKDGAAAIAMDIVFAEPDRTSPELIAKSLPGLSPQARGEIQAARSHDEIFAEALRNSRVVVAQSAYSHRRGPVTPAQSPKASIATIGGDPKAYLPSYPEILTNIQPLEDAATGRGLVTIRPDSDGVIRRVPVMLSAKDSIMPSLGVELLRVATGQTTLLIKSDEAGMKSIVVAGAEIPTDSSGHVWVYFSRHQPERFISAKDVLEGTVDPARLKGKLVLIGTSAIGLFDVKTTPTEPVMPGVEVHAQLLENILTQSALKRPSYAVGAEICLALAIGIAIIVLVPILGAFTVFALGAATTALLIGFSWLLYIRYGMLVDVAYPTISSVGVFLVLVFTNYFREEAQRRQIRSAFGQYLSPALVEQLADDPDRLVLGGETRDMTVLFSDVRGFTTISESYKNDPQGLTSLMNRFLTPLSNAIIDHNGTIDKYMGDAVMAFWNAPLDDESHALRACDAALDMLKRLGEVNTEREAEAKDAGQRFIPLDVGIGINTGDCVVGNMGSDIRFDYSVLGDSVNLASRLEGQSKAYGVPIILGSSTAERVGDAFATLELDFIRVKGKTEPEIIHTLLGRRDEVDLARYQALRQQMHDMLKAYREGNWAGALQGVTACRKANGEFSLEALYDLYRRRIAAFQETAPADWDGVFTLQTK